MYSLHVHYFVLTVFLFCLVLTTISVYPLALPTKPISPHPPHTQPWHGPQATDRYHQCCKWAVLVLRCVQPLPWGDGERALKQQLPGRLWNHPHAQGVFVCLCVGLY